MSVDQKVFEGIVADLKSIVDTRVKRSLRILIKERKEKEQKMTIADDLKSLRSYYTQQIGIIFDRIESDAFISGVMQYSEYVEPKDDDE